MTLASIIVPAFNVEDTIAQTLQSLISQTHHNFEIIVVDDGSTDASASIAATYLVDPRVRVIRQTNRGLAGARNSGIAASRGTFIAFCDADDLWEPEKLARHVTHLEANPQVGVSYSGSAFIDDDGALTGQAQRPRLHDIEAMHVFRRNPIGNGSAAVIRRAVFDAIAFHPEHETQWDWYFDETFRQSEDIECWMRIVLSTDWEFEGVEGLLTQYRISAGGLSAATDRQLAAWERMVDKLGPLAPDFFETQAPIARAYQLRYLSRRAVSCADAAQARALTKAWLKTSLVPLRDEILKSIVTLGAVAVLSLLGPQILQQALSLVARTARKETIQ